MMGRLANPVSKIATVLDLSEHFGVRLSIPAVYRMMVNQANSEQLQLVRCKKQSVLSNG